MDPIFHRESLIFLGKVAKQDGAANQGNLANPCSWWPNPVLGFRPLRPKTLKTLGKVAKKSWVGDRAFFTAVTHLNFLLGE